MASKKQQLHWTQRVALIRHNLHVASRGLDFSFFKTLQAAGFMEGTNHVATLSEELGDDADVVSAAMDNLNAGLAYVHQDAFKTVYENLKNSMRDEEKGADISKLYVDITMQRNMADMAIDKMTSSALALINQQPATAQDTAADMWITGTTMTADAMEVVLKEMNALEGKMDDFIRMEESWNNVKASVICAVTGLKGVFRLMDPTSPQDSAKSSPRTSSIASASGSIMRKLSNAFAIPNTSNSRSSSIATTSTHPRHSSVSSLGPVYRTLNYVRNSVSAVCPISMPPPTSELFEHHKLSMIPQTPAAAMSDDQPDPFDTSVPPVPYVPEVPSMPEPALSIEARRMSQAVM